MATPVPLPGTDFWILDEDSAHTLAAREAGTIKTEHCLMGLPELERLGPGSVVFDVGAFVGDTARFFLDKGCKVWAFEPFPDAFACLRKNCPEAVCINEPVGDGRAVALVDECDDIYAHHANNFGTRRVREGRERTTLKIDDLLNPMLPASIERLDLLKIDVEGFEPAVLLGARAAIERHRPLILFEAFDSMLARFGWTRKDLLDTLPAGYQYRVCIGEEAHDRCDYIAWPE